MSGGGEGAIGLDVEVSPKPLGSQELGVTKNVEPERGQRDSYLARFQLSCPILFFPSFIGDFQASTLFIGRLLGRKLRSGENTALSTRISRI